MARINYSDPSKASDRTREILVMVEGAAKSARIAEVLEGPQDPTRLPIQLIHAQKKYLWLIDVPAAGM